MKPLGLVVCAAASWTVVVHGLLRWWWYGAPFVSVAERDAGATVSAIVAFALTLNLVLWLSDDWDLALK